MMLPAPAGRLQDRLKETGKLESGCGTARPRKPASRIRQARRPPHRCRPARRIANSRDARRWRPPPRRKPERARLRRFLFRRIKVLNRFILFANPRGSPSPRLSLSATVADRLQSPCRAVTRNPIRWSPTASETLPVPLPFSFPVCLPVVAKRPRPTLPAVAKNIKSIFSARSARSLARSLMARAALSMVATGST